MSNKVISTEEFDQKFDDGEDISDYIDFDSIRSLHSEPRQINVELPMWMVKGLDKEAQRLGVTRKYVIKTWLSEKLR